MRRRALWLSLAAALIVAIGVTPAFASLSGAIFTTKVDGTRVNANIYPAKTDVYLDGGPGSNAPTSAAGLPAGWYVFQVTDPSGKTLLSQDPIGCRRFEVGSDGIIVGVRGFDWKQGNVTSYFEHLTGVDVDHGATTVQLMPYSDTPNPGGVYKVWAMLESDYLTANGWDGVDEAARDKILSRTGQPGAKFHGFVPSMSKTDNYKVKGREPQRLIVKKFCDANGDGVWDKATEQEIPGWEIAITGPTGIEDTRFTPVDFMTEVSGTWKVCESASLGGGDNRQWKQTALIVDDGVKTVSPCASVLYGRTGGEAHTVIFGNVPLGRIVAHKFEDVNCNRVQDSGEQGVPSFCFTLTGTSGAAKGYTRTLCTDDEGDAVFDGLLPGTYTLTEQKKAGWLPTTAMTQDIVLETCADGPDPVVVTKAFGNVKAITVCALKWHDVNGDGEFIGEPWLKDWEFCLTGTDVMGNTVNECGTTDSTGKVCWGDLYPGDYKITETLPDDTTLTLASGMWEQRDDGICQVKPAARERSAHLGFGSIHWQVWFGNCAPGCIEGIKLRDTDGDGDGDEPLPGWKIHLTGTTAQGEVKLETVTGPDGGFKWCDLWPGTYKVCEEKRDGWRPMTDTCFPISLSSGGSGTRTFINCEETELSVCKYNDLDGDGTCDLDEPKLAGFKIHVRGGPDGYDNTLTTGESGCVLFDHLLPGTYFVEEIPPEGEGWTCTAMCFDAGDGIGCRPGNTKGPQEIVLASGVPGSAGYWNLKPGCIVASKFYDANMNTVKDPDEGWVQGFKFVVTGRQNFDFDGDGSLDVYFEGYTDENGIAQFCGLWPGEYTLTEIMPDDPCWEATTEMSHDIPLRSGDSIEKLFGNVCIEKLGFKTKGFWHNKNGTDLITADDVAALNDLEYDGLKPFAAAADSWEFPFDGTWTETGNTYFGEGAVGEISDFLTASESRDEIPQRFQLLQQLCAFVLNVRHFGDGMDQVLTLPGGTVWKASDLVAEAIKAWSSGDGNCCSSIQEIIESYNSAADRGEWIYVVKLAPCPIIYPY